MPAQLATGQLATGAPSRITRRSALRAGLLAAASAGGAGALAGCDARSSGGPSAAPGPVTIKAAGLPAAEPNPAVRELFLADVKEFEAANPGVTIQPVEYRWDPDTFTAKLAGGQLETVFQVPFTEPQKLIAQGQVADIGAHLAASPYTTGLNPNVLAVAQGDGKTYGLPLDAYSLALLINRDLFTKAGLDPDTPPTTWDEVREAAGRISRLGGNVAGFAMPAQEGFGGWYVTQMNASFGNDVEIKQGESWAPNFNDPVGVSVLQLLHELRWTDKSMGENVLRTQDDVTKAFAAGQVGIFPAAPSQLNGAIANFGGDRKAYGIGPYPQQGGNAVLTGGTMNMFSPKASPAELDAAVKWAGFHDLRHFTEPDAIKKYFESLKEAKQSVGIPMLPLYDEKTTSAFLDIQKDYENVPTSQYQTYLTTLPKLALKTEPPVEAQKLYQALEDALQAVLSKQDTDPKGALDDAAKQVEGILANAQ